MKQDKLKIEYDSLWKYVIRTPRYNYSEEQLGPPTFIYLGKIYKRKVAMNAPENIYILTPK